jgi:hypothetical protein
MSVLTGSGYCPHCREEVMLACSAGANLLHLALTLITGGLWGIVWLYCQFRAHACVCCQCGLGLSRAQIKALLRPASDTTWPFDLKIHNRSEFNGILVAHNLVYYVPTSARYHRACWR